MPRGLCVLATGGLFIWATLAPKPPSQTTNWRKLKQIQLQQPTADPQFVLQMDLLSCFGINKALQLARADHARPEEKQRHHTPEDRFSIRCRSRGLTLFARGSDGFSSIGLAWPRVVDEERVRGALSSGIDRLPRLSWKA